MKKIGTLCSVILGTVFIFCSLNACKNEPKQDNTEEVAEDQNEAGIDDDEATKADAQYLADAVSIDLMVIRMGGLAKRKGVHAEVKKFGKMMVDEHNKSAGRTNDLGEAKSITLPTTITKDGQEEYNKLNEKSGTDFDKKFAEMMVDNHQKAINLLRRASEDASDPEIRDWAANQILALTEHLGHAKVLKESVDD